MHPVEIEPPHPDASGRRTVAVLSTLALLLLLGLASARPAWKRLKEYRASRFLAEGRSFEASGEMRRALDRGRSALQLTPSDPEALRFNAELASRLGMRNGLSFWSRLVESGHATEEDLTSYVENGLRLDRSDLVRDIASNIVSRGNLSARGERIAALYFASINQRFEALHHARNAHAADPGNPTNAVLLADLLLVEPAADAVREARDLYWQAARSTPALRPHGLRKLALPPLGDRSDREQLVEILASVTNRTAPEDLLLVETQVRLDPSSASQIISNVIASLPHDNLPRASALADTLRRLGRHTDNLRLTAGGREFRSPELFRARLEALLATGEVEQAYRLTLARDVPLPPFELELARVRTAQRTGDVQRRDTHLRELITAAGLHPTRLRSACEIAEELDAPGIAAEGWRILSQQPADAVEAYRRLQRLADRGGDTWTARDFAQRAARAGVADAALRLDIARYDLLLADEPDRALAEALRQVEADPSNFKARAVLALAHLRHGDAAQARAAVDRQVVDMATSGPDTLAILSAVYGQNGATRKALELARAIPLAQLRPEERELIRPWLLPAPITGIAPGPAPGRR